MFNLMFKMDILRGKQIKEALANSGHLVTATHHSHQPPPTRLNYLSAQARPPLLIVANQQDLQCKSLDFESLCFIQSRSSAEMSGRLAISASARGMAEDSSSSRQMKKTTKTYVMKTDSQGNVTTHTDVQVSGSGSSESG